MTHSSPSAAPARCAAALAAATALTCAGGSFLFARHAVGAEATTANGAFELALCLAAAVLLARLSWICAASVAACRDDLPEAHGAPNTATRRAATIFVTLATAVIGATTTAHAQAPPAATGISATDLPALAPSGPKTGPASGSGAVPQPTFVPIEPSADAAPAACSPSTEPEWTGRDAVAPAGCQGPDTSAPSGAVPVSDHSGDHHVVRPGDTLWGLAARSVGTNTDGKALAAAVEQWTHVNPLAARHPERLAVGTTLRVPTSNPDGTGAETALRRTAA